MLPICNDGRLANSLKILTWTTQSTLSFCTDLVVNGACISPSTQYPQYVVQGATVTSPLQRSSNDYITWIINGAPSAAKTSVLRQLEELGCPLYFGPKCFADWSGNGYPYFKPCSYTNCVFSNTRPVFVGTSSCKNRVFEYWDCDLTYSAQLVEADINYYSICCNADNAETIRGIDPFTQQSFSSVNCSDAWCLSDPQAQCLPLFNACQGTSSCHRHWYLGTETLPTSDTLLSSLTIIGKEGNGVWCNAWYDTSALLATIQYVSDSYEKTITTTRTAAVMSQITSYCTDPYTYGNGECACINGILDISGGLAEPGPKALTNQVGRANKIPTLLMQFGSEYRRMDAHCLSPPLQSTTVDNITWVTTSLYTEQLSITDGGITYSISNACSTTTPWSEYDVLSSLPSLNPNLNLRSLSQGGNFGDIAFSDVTGVYESDNINPFSIPFHCWLPACTGLIPTFKDMTLFTRTCPSICYSFAGGNSIGIDTIDPSANVTVDTNVLQCPGSSYGFDGSPFELSCQYADIQVPVDFQGVMSITVQNPTHEISSFYAGRSLTAFSNLLPVVSFNGAGTYGPFAVYKYSISQADDPALQTLPTSITLPITINVQGLTPSSYFTQLLLVDNFSNKMTLPINVTIQQEGFNPVACQGQDNAVCIPCDSLFGSNSQFSPAPPSFRSNLQPSGFALPISITSEYLLLTGLLGTHQTLYGQPINVDDT